MPVYKTKESFLREAIESVLAQTFGDFEFLILDDCPKAPREEIVKSYHDHRIRYLRNSENLGVAHTRNRLMGLARGAYFAVMDHDDVWLPQKLERQIAFLEANPEVVACGTAYHRFGHWYRSFPVVYPKGHEAIKSLLFFKCPLHHPSLVVCASAVRDGGVRYNPAYISVNDRDFYWQLAQLGNLANLSTVLCRYRQHKTNTSKLQRTTILAEQRNLRQVLLAKLGLVLSVAEFEIFNENLMRGARIREKVTLQKLKQLMAKLQQANRQTNTFPRRPFERLCRAYLLKRTLKAYLGGVF